MITIDFSTLGDRKAAAKAKKKELIHQIGSKGRVTITKEESEFVESQPLDPVIIEKVKKDNEVGSLQSALWKEYNDSFVLPMNKLSTQIAHMVNRGATQAELAEHYEKIESYRPGRIALYEKIRYVEQYGKLPEAPEPEKENLDPYYLKDRKKKLVDKRCKLRAKLRTNANPSKPAKLLEWEQELAQADMEYLAVEEKLKQIEGKA